MLSPQLNFHIIISVKYATNITNRRKMINPVNTVPIRVYGSFISSFILRPDYALNLDCDWITFAPEQDHAVMETCPD